MKKEKIFLLFLITLLFTNHIWAQELNKVVFSKKLNVEILIGECNIDAFKIKKFKKWFDPEYKNYKVSKGTVKKISSKGHFDIVVVFASWCEDSRRELPRFYKIFNTIGYENINLKLYGVNGSKYTESVDTKTLGIERVPTFIFYKNGKEIGRITESPQKKLEKDILEILER